MKNFKLVSILSLVLCMISNYGISQEQVSVKPSTKEVSTEVSTEELKTFADIYQKVQVKNSEAQQRMAKSIKEEDITINRYQDLAKSKQDPNSEVTASEEEKEKLKSIQESFTEIQTEFKKKITDIIESEGMTIKRYQEVYQMVRKDKSLQEELGELMNG